MFQLTRRFTNSYELHLNVNVTLAKQQHHHLVCFSFFVESYACRHMTIRSVRVLLSLIWLWWCITNADCYTSLTSIIIQFDNKLEQKLTHCQPLQCWREEKKKHQQWRKIWSRRQKKCNDLTIRKHTPCVHSNLMAVPLLLWQIVFEARQRLCKLITFRESRIGMMSEHTCVFLFPYND